MFHMQNKYHMVEMRIYFKKCCILTLFLVFAPAILSEEDYENDCERRDILRIQEQGVK